MMHGLALAAHRDEDHLRAARTGRAAIPVAEHALHREPGASQRVTAATVSGRARDVASIPAADGTIGRFSSTGRR
jgi:hypothetical protein